jgi:hypothetical protein
MPSPATALSLFNAVSCSLPGPRLPHTAIPFSWQGTHFIWPLFSSPLFLNMKMVLVLPQACLYCPNIKYQGLNRVPDECVPPIVASSPLLLKYCAVIKPINNASVAYWNSSNIDRERWSWDAQCSRHQGESLLVFVRTNEISACSENCLALRSVHDSFLLAQGRGHWRALSGAGAIYKRW